MDLPTLTAVSQAFAVLANAGPGAASAGGHAASSGVGGAMFFFFLLVFGIAAYILKKHAFGPILSKLDEREATIETSLKQAEILEREMAQLEAKIAARLEETEQKTRDMLDAAREAAREAARGIEAQAKEQAEILRENALRDIASARGKAEASLRATSAEVAVALTMKLLDQNLDAKARKALTDKLIAEI